MIYVIKQKENIVTNFKIKLEEIDFKGLNFVQQANYICI